MKFPFRDFWGRLIVKFGGFPYKHSVASNFEVDDYRRKQTRRAGPFLIRPFGFDIQYWFTF